MTQLESLTASSAQQDRAATRTRVRELQKLMAVFLKAGKTLRLYNEGHEFFSRFADEFETRLEAEFEHGDSLTLEITPNAILWDGHVVHENKEHRENLAFKLYRDGVRLLQFREGVTADQTRDFVTLVAREGDVKGSGQDLSVLFWESDFKHIHIAVAETFVDYDEEANKALKQLETDLGTFEREFGLEKRELSEDQLDELKRIWQGGHPTLAGGGGAGGSEGGGGKGATKGLGTVAAPAYEPAALAAYGDTELHSRTDDLFAGKPVFDPTDMPALPAESLDDLSMELVYADLHGLEQAYASFEEVGGVLAHVVEGEGDAEELVEFLKHLDDALAPLLSTAAIGPLNSVLRRIALIARRESEAGSFRAEPLNDFVRGIGRLERLQVLARAINEDWQSTLRGDLFSFVSIQDPRGFDELMGFLAALHPEEPRQVVVDAMVLLSGKRPDPWVRALDGGNWHLVIDAMEALSVLGDVPALEHVVPLFDRTEPQVRLKVLDVLKKERSARIVELVFRGLEDEDSAVRLAALRYCAVHRLKEAVPTLQRAIEHRAFRAFDFSEKRGWHITFGLLGGGAALDEVKNTLESALHSGDHGEDVHLALLTAKAVRETAARAWLADYIERASGDLSLLARKIMAGG